MKNFENLRLALCHAIFISDSKPSTLVSEKKLLTREDLFQCDPLAMTMYSLFVPPLVERFEEEPFMQRRNANDESMAGKSETLRRTLDNVINYGKHFSYVVKLSK